MAKRRNGQAQRAQPEPRTDTRLSIPIKLGAEDADIERWYRALPKGKRHEAVKAAIRAGMGGGGGELRRIEDMTKTVYQALSDMPAWFEERLSRLTLVQGVGTPKALEVEATPRLAKPEIDERANRMKKAKW